MNNINNNYCSQEKRCVAVDFRS